VPRYGIKEKFLPSEEKYGMIDARVKIEVEIDAHGYEEGELIPLEVNLSEQSHRYISVPGDISSLLCRVHPSIIRSFVAHEAAKIAEDDGVEELNEILIDEGYKLSKL
jgi:hypothetical protein